MISEDIEKQFDLNSPDEAPLTRNANLKSYNSQTNIQKVEPPKFFNFVEKSISHSDVEITGNSVVLDSPEQLGAQSDFTAEMNGTDELQ